ncbi:hypothetical protein D3C78_1998300 [compost metagenome]
MINHNDALVRVAEHMTGVLVALWVTVGDDAEALPEQTVMGGDHHLNPAQVGIAEEQVDDV